VVPVRSGGPLPDRYQLCLYWIPKVTVSEGYNQRWLAWYAGSMSYVVYFLPDIYLCNRVMLRINDKYQTSDKIKYSQKSWAKRSGKKYKLLMGYFGNIGSQHVIFAVKDMIHLRVLTRVMLKVEMHLKLKSLLRK
jgi:hypothetical protein